MFPSRMENGPRRHLQGPFPLVAGTGFEPATSSPSPSEPTPFTGLPINDSLLLKVSEAAAALRISRSSLYRLFESGELAWVQIGASRRVTSAEVHRFIAAHTEAAS
jgi:excisionase family DNA binding protein